ncbi:MAG: DNA gyrase inhibitor YacG [Pseudomonadota bacterium]
MPTTVSCPTCEKQVLWSQDSPHRPFCSRHCKLIDLGEWFEENHRIAGSGAEDDEDTPDRPHLPYVDH